MAKIENWNPERGFGFARVGGQRVFIHCSVVSPRPARGADLTGREVEVAGVEDGPKGRKATSVKLLPTAEELEIERRKEEERRREREAEEERRRGADARWEERRRQLAAEKGSFLRLQEIRVAILARPEAKIEKDTDVDFSVSFPGWEISARAYIDGNGDVVEQGDTREFYWVPVEDGHRNFPDLGSLATYLRENGAIGAKVFFGFWSAIRDYRVKFCSWSDFFSGEELGFPADPENFTFCTKCKTWYRKEDLAEKAWSQKWGAGVHVECPSGHLLDSRQEWIKEMPYRKGREEEPLEALHGLMKDD